MKNFGKSEVFYEINDREVTMVATFACLMNIEKKIKKSVLKLIFDLNESGILMQELQVILQEGLKAGGNSYSKKQIQELMTQIGFTESYLLAVRFLKSIYLLEEY